MSPNPRSDQINVSSAAQAIGLDMDVLQQRVDQLLDDELYWFPVRHHSPMLARWLEQVIESRRPKIIFIEGPADATPLVPHIVDSQTRPPVAIYSSYRDDSNVLGLAGIASPAPEIPARFACWLPLLPYSPEYVAMQAAKRTGAKVVFIDLPHHALIRGKHDHALPNEPAETPDGGVPDAGKELDSGGNDELIARTSFYQKLAEIAGYRTWDEAWDSLFELREFADAESARRDMAMFCGAARATADACLMALDGTLERERFMLRTIEETLASQGVARTEAIVVCGGFHIFLDREDKTAPPEIPEGTVYNTVVPYSYFRLSELSGYEAGNRAPQYYQVVWEFARKDKMRDSLVEHVIEIMRLARKRGVPVSSADAISICHHAEMLGRLRGRTIPVLDDINDAVVTCCCKGDPAEEGKALIEAIAAAGIGTRIGRVTPALGQLPIVIDFYQQLDELQVSVVDETRQRLTLDKRQDLDNRRSILLHRLTLLDVPLAVLTAQPGGDFVSGKIFQEKWQLGWSPEVESKLIEKALYGDTIESAALARLREELAAHQGQAGEVSRRLVAAINMDFPNLVAEVESACSQAIDNDARFVSLSEALNHLMVLERYADYRNMRHDTLQDLITRCFARACFTISDVIAVPEERQQEVVRSLMALAEAVLRDRQLNLDRGLFIQSLHDAATATPVPFLRGVFLGLLAELKEIPAEQLSMELAALAKAAPDQMMTAGDFLDGIMAVSRTSIMLGAASLVQSVDELLRAADWSSFLTMLPRMRGAMDRLHARQRDSLAQEVAQLYGLADSDSIVELRTTVGAAALMAEIDAKVAAIMQRWEF